MVDEETRKSIKFFRKLQFPIFTKRINEENNENSNKKKGKLAKKIFIQSYSIFSSHPVAILCTNKWKINESKLANAKRITNENLNNRVREKRIEMKIRNRKILRFLLLSHVRYLLCVLLKIAKLYLHVVYFPLDCNLPTNLVSWLTVCGASEGLPSETLSRKCSRFLRILTF